MARRFRPHQKSERRASSAFAVVFSSILGAGAYAIAGGFIFHDGLLIGIGAALVAIAVLAWVLTPT